MGEASADADENADVIGLIAPAATPPPGLSLAAVKRRLSPDDLKRRIGFV